MGVILNLVRNKYKIMENKILILEASGFDSIRYSIDKEIIKREDLNNFFQQQNIELHSAGEAYENGELNYSEHPNLDTLSTYQSFSNLNNSTSAFKKGKHIISEEGTVDQTKNEKDKLSVYIDCLTKDKKTFEDWTPPKISNEDKSYILLAQRKKIESTDNVAILAHDQKLRIHASRRGILTFGSSSLLASMVISGIYSYQEGISIYYSWHKENAGWIPPFRALEEYINENNIVINIENNKRKASFEEIINNEKIRIKNNKSFFVNK